MQDQIKIQDQKISSDDEFDSLEMQQHLGQLKNRQNGINKEVGKNLLSQREIPHLEIHKIGGSEELSLIKDNREVGKNLLSQRKIPRLNIHKIRENDGFPIVEDIDENLYYSRSMIENPNLQIQEDDVKHSQRNNKDKSDGKNFSRSMIENPTLLIQEEDLRNTQLNNKDKSDGKKNIPSKRNFENDKIALHGTYKRLNKKMQQLIQQSIILSQNDKEALEGVSQVFSKLSNMTSQQQKSTIKLFNAGRDILTPRQTPRQETQPNIFKQTNNDFKIEEINSEEEKEAQLLSKEINEEKFNTYLKTLPVEELCKLLGIDRKQYQKSLQYKEDNSPSQKIESSIMHDCDNNDNESETQPIRDKMDYFVREIPEIYPEDSDIQYREEKPQLILEDKIEEKQNFMQRIFNVCRTKKENRTDFKEDLKAQSSEVISSPLDGDQTSRSTANISIRDLAIQERPQTDAKAEKGDQTSRSTVQINIRHTLMQEIAKMGAEDKIESNNSRFIYLCALISCRKKEARNEVEKQEKLEVMPSPVDVASSSADDIDTKNKKTRSCCQSKNFTSFLVRQSSSNSKEGVKMD